MVAEGKDSILSLLWRGKFYIVLALLLLITAAAGLSMYMNARNVGSQLSQKDADYNALNDKYNKLTYDHSALVQSNNDLTQRYDNVTGRYNNLSIDNLYLKSSYDGLNNTVSRFQETGGVVIALYYSFYQGGSSSSPKKEMEATAYNVGNKKADKVTIKCQVIDNGSVSTSTQTFTNVDPLDKRRSKWEYSNTTQLEDVWIELS